jgi:hypothetical protein
VKASPTEPDPHPRLEQHVLARTLRGHPEWSLENVLGIIESGGPRADALGGLTIAELLDGPDEERPILDLVRRRRATRCKGDEFDQLVLEVLCEAGDEVAAGYLRDRLGGPRWKLQDSLRRLVPAGKVARSGTTSKTRYQAVRE